MSYVSFYLVRQALESYEQRFPVPNDTITELKKLLARSENISTIIDMAMLFRQARISPRQYQNYLKIVTAIKEQAKDIFELVRSQLDQKDADNFSYLFNAIMDYSLFSDLAKSDFERLETLTKEQLESARYFLDQFFLAYTNRRYTDSRNYVVIHNALRHPDIPALVAYLKSPYQYDARRFFEQLTGSISQGYSWDGNMVKQVLCGIMMGRVLGGLICLWVQWSPELAPKTRFFMEKESEYAFFRLKAIFREFQSDPDGTFRKCQQFLEDRWEMIQGTDISYDRFPGLPINQACLDVAYYLEIMGYGKALSLLMPNLPEDEICQMSQTVRLILRLPDENGQQRVSCPSQEDLPFIQRFLQRPEIPSFFARENFSVLCQIRQEVASLDPSLRTLVSQAISRIDYEWYSLNVSGLLRYDKSYYGDDDGIIGVAMAKAAHAVSLAISRAQQEGRHEYPISDVLFVLGDFKNELPEQHISFSCIVAECIKELQRGLPPIEVARVTSGPTFFGGGASPSQPGGRDGQAPALRTPAH